MQNPSQKNLTRTQAKPGAITRLLSNQRDPESLRQVITMAYDELHDIASHYCRREPPGRSLQPTLLVNEVCLKILQSKQSFKNRPYFFTAAATMMERWLVDAARKRLAQRHGGGLQRVDFRYAERLGFEEPQNLLDFDAALARLQKVRPLLSQIAKLRVFGELSNSEVATVLGIAASTARSRWAHAREWLRRDLEASGRD